MKVLRIALSFPILIPSVLGSLAFSVGAVDDLVISEFMAQNDTTLADEDGDFPDWIEIYNAGTNTVNLNGWFLTDDPGTFNLWRFPSTNLQANGYLLVFASNKNRRIPGAPLHTNFKLNNSGDYLALVKPDGITVQSAYAPAFPLQVGDVSYGFPVVQSTRSLITNGSPARL